MDDNTFTERSTALWAQIRKCEQTGDASDLYARFLKENAPLLSIAIRPFLNRMDEDEARQEAAIAVWEAVQRFQPARGVPFGSYAVKCIRWRLHRVCAQDAPVRIPEYQISRVMRYKTTFDRLADDLQRQPDRAEVAEALGLSVTEILEVERIIALRNPVSLDTPMEDGEDLADVLCSDSGAFEEQMLEHIHEADLTASWAVLGASLTQRQMAILRMRFRDGMTNKAISEVLGISRQRVTQIEREAFHRLMQSDKLRDELASMDEEIMCQVFHRSSLPNATKRNISGDVEELAIRLVENERKIATRAIRTARKELY